MNNTNSDTDNESIPSLDEIETMAADCLAKLASHCGFWRRNASQKQEQCGSCATVQAIFENLQYYEHDRISSWPEVIND